MKKIKLTFGISIMLVYFIFVSCDKYGPDCTNVDVHQSFLLTSMNGRDSLYLDSICKDMSIHYLTKGEFKKDDSALRFYRHGDSVWLEVALNGNATTKDISYTCIKWGENDVDTISAKIRRGSTSNGCDYFIITMQSYNDSLWTPGTSGNYIFTKRK